MRYLGVQGVARMYRMDGHLVLGAVSGVFAKKCC